MFLYYYLMFISRFSVPIFLKKCHRLGKIPIMPLSHLRPRIRFAHETLLTVKADRACRYQHLLGATGTTQGK